MTDVKRPADFKLRNMKGSRFMPSTAMNQPEVELNINDEEIIQSQNSF